MIELENFESRPQVQVAIREKEPMTPRIVSILLHPLFMAIYGVALLFTYTDFKYVFASQFSSFMIPVIVFSCLVPCSCIYFLKRTGYISDLSLSRKEERFLPFLVTFISYSLLFYYFYKAGLYPWFLGVLSVPLILIVICSAINSFWKISAHMAAIGGLLGSVFSVCYNIKGQNPYGLFIILIILVGALGVSRLILRRHTPAQVYAGFLLGLSVSYIVVFVGGYYPLLLLWMHSI